MSSRDIYHKQTALESIDENIEKFGFDKESCSQILEFKKFLQLSGMSRLRVLKYIYTCISIRRALGKPFKQATKQDIMRIVEEIERSELSPWTKYGYRLVLKKFYKWLQTGRIDGKDYPEIVDWIPLRIGSGSNHRLPEEILTPEEVKRMVDAATNIRDKAFVHALYESGCRIGEFLGLKLKNVQFDDYGAVLIVEGKTGMRRVRVIASAPALALWIDNHPKKDDPESPLWVSLASNSMGKPLDYAGAAKMLKTLAKRARIKKKVNPHSFRHARATHLASKLTESQMKELFGWAQSSRMAAVYVHLSGRDVDHALLELYGLSKRDERKEGEAVKTCPRCGEKNPGDARFCKRCALVLDLQTAKEIQRAEDVLTRLLKNPRTRKMLLQAVYQLESEKK